MNPNKKTTNILIKVKKEPKLSNMAMNWNTMWRQCMLRTENLISIKFKVIKTIKVNMVMNLDTKQVDNKTEQDGNK